MSFEKKFVSFSIFKSGVNPIALLLFKWHLSEDTHIMFENEYKDFFTNQDFSNLQWSNCNNKLHDNSKIANYTMII